MNGHLQVIPTVQVDGAEVIITERRFAPGTEIRRHRHGHNYMVVSLANGTLLLETPESDRHVSLIAGQAYFCKADAEHNVINAGTHKVVFVETETE